MNAKRWSSLLLVLALLGLVAYQWRTTTDVVSPVAKPASGRAPVAATPPPPRSLPGQPALVAPEPGELATDLRPPLLDALGARGSKPEEEARVVLGVFNAYRRTFGGYPAGDSNRQFVNALRGKNSQHLPFVPSDHPRINPQGELVDAWATPFFFHLLARDVVEIRSAGPDRQMYTSDDVIASSAEDH